MEYSKAGSLDSRPASWKPQAVTGSGAGASGLVAWDPVRGTTAWEIKGQMSGGVLSTAGGLVFFGTSDGWVRCVNQKTGQVLWSFKMPSGVIGDPISFGGVGGRQFIGVISGIGGWAGIGLGQAMPIPSQPRPGEHLLGSSYEILNASYHTGSKVTAVGGTSSGSPPGGILTVFAVDAPGEVTFAENPLDTIPQFPWPPPKMTDRIVLPRGLVVTGTRDKIRRCLQGDR